MSKSISAKKAVILLGLAVAAELVLLTDWVAGSTAKLISSNVVLQSVISFLMVYIFWIVGILIIRTLYRRNPTIHFSYTEKPSKKRGFVSLLLLLITVIISYISWDGFKVYKELHGSITYVGLGLGIINFIAQYFYYFLEGVFIIIIIAFAQEAGEVLFKPRWIPYGGIALALLWGLDHIAFHGVVDGLITTINAILYGVAFLVLQKNIKLAFWLVLLMFLL